MRRERFAAPAGSNRRTRWTRVWRATAVFVCVLLSLEPARVDAQSMGALATTRNRDLARACWYDSNQADCIRFVRANWYWIVNAVVTAIRAPSGPGSGPPPSQGAMPAVFRGRTSAASLVQIVPVGSTAPGVMAATVWDGTFAHPNAPSFYTLRGLAPLDTSDDACAQMPEGLKGDGELLQLLSCAAEQELDRAGPDRWQEERAELQELRGRLAACMPVVAAGTDPCAAP